MEMVTISLTSELNDCMNRALSHMDLTLEEFLERTFSAETAILEKKVTITELFQGYEGDYQGESYDWGNPVGRETW